MYTLLVINFVELYISLAFNIFWSDRAGQINDSYATRQTNISEIQATTTTGTGTMYPTRLPFSSSASLQTRIYQIRASVARVNVLSVFIGAVK